MESHEVKSVLIKKLPPLQEIRVSGDGRHFQIVAVGKIFDDMNRVNRQKTIYAPLKEYIADGRIHAVSVKVYTPQEWESHHKVNNF